jgi:hypothetical protein
MLWSQTHWKKNPAAQEEEVHPEIPHEFPGGQIEQFVQTVIPEELANLPFAHLEHSEEPETFEK